MRGPGLALYADAHKDGFAPKGSVLGIAYPETSSVLDIINASQGLPRQTDKPSLDEARLWRVKWCNDGAELGVFWTTEGKRLWNMGMDLKGKTEAETALRWFADKAHCLLHPAVDKDLAESLTEHGLYLDAQGSPFLLPSSQQSHPSLRDAYQRAFSVIGIHSAISTDDKKLTAARADKNEWRWLCEKRNVAAHGDYQVWLDGKSGRIGIPCLYPPDKRNSKLKPIPLLPSFITQMTERTFKFYIRCLREAYPGIQTGF